MSTDETDAVVKAIARIAELDTAIAAYPSWGAALTAMDEERNKLTAFVARQKKQSESV